MKLQPRQIIGLVAIVVFGGIMIFRLTQPSEKQIMEQRLASLPPINVPAPALPPLDLSAVPTVPPLDLSSSAPTTTSPTSSFDPGAQDYLNVGSQAARDDMYCSGVMSAEFENIKSDGDPDRMSLLLRDQMALDTAGLAKLKAENLLGDTEGASFSLAYVAKAREDYAAKALRIPVADCSKRAAALN